MQVLNHKRVLHGNFNPGQCHFAMQRQNILLYYGREGIVEVDPLLLHEPVCNKSGLVLDNRTSLIHNFMHLVESICAIQLHAHAKRYTCE